MALFYLVFYRYICNHLFTTMNTRLEQFLAAENLSQTQFAESIDVARAGVSHLLAGRNKPSYEFIRAVMQKYPALNMEWLILGKGKMYKEARQEAPAPAPPAAMQDEGSLFPASDEALAESSIPDEPESAPVHVSCSYNHAKVAKISVKWHAHLHFLE